MATNIYDTATVAQLAAAQHEKSIFGGLRRRFDRLKDQARIRTELRAMTDRDLADLGLCASDINDVARGTYRRDA